MTDKNYRETMRLSELLPLYILGQISEAQLSELNNITGSVEATDRMAAEAMAGNPDPMPESAVGELHDKTWKAISDGLWKNQRRNRRLTLWISSSAAAIATVMLLLPLGRNVSVQTDEARGVRLLLANGEELTLTVDVAPDKFVVDKENKTLTVIDTEQDAETDHYTLIVPARNVYNMTLPDGSRVTLNANSRLVFPQRFDGGSRTVYLEGEAYFSVKEDKTKPFIVRNGEFVTTVLGTEFSVKGYGEERCVVTLVSGSVTVGNGAGMVQKLTPGRQAVMGRVDIAVNEVDVEYYTGWKDGYFVFRNESLSEVVRQIADWYDVEYTIENKQKGDEKIRARIIRYDEFEDMTGVIGGIRNVTVEGGRIVIR